MIRQNKIIKTFHKELLPTGDVFDEARFIEPGDMSQNYFQWKNKKFFLTICEDIWAWSDKKGQAPYKVNPLAKVKKKKVLIEKETVELEFLDATDCSKYLEVSTTAIANAINKGYLCKGFTITRKKIEDE